MLEQLISGLCDYLEIDLLQPTTDGVYEIVFDEGILVEIQALSGTQVLMRSELLTLPENRDEWEAPVQRHLKENMLVLREQTSTMSIDVETGVIWLFQTTHAGKTSVQEFCEQLSAFTVTLEWWNKRGDAGPLTHSVMPQMFLRP